MEAPRICDKHNKKANQICTNTECYQLTDILICPECSARHYDHRSQIIEIGLLNERVLALMNKRQEFEDAYFKSCQALVNELKKFKMFKEELFSYLNIKERALNDICKKIRRKIPYEKDKELFKNHFGYVYLSMKGLNSNMDTYAKFRSQVAETMAGSRNILRKFEVNCVHSEIPTLMQKQYQIASILKKTKEGQPEPKYHVPEFNRLRKQTIKFKGVQSPHTKLLRVNEQQFLTLQGDCLSWCNIRNFLFPNTIPLRRKLVNIALLDKNAFITTEDAGILIYDLINERLIKQYASSNHKNASITNLLTVNSTTVLNFITCPNQIVALRFNEEAGSLKVLKGVETDSKCLDARLLHDSFAALYDNKVVSTFRTENLEKQREYIFDSLMKTCAKIGDNLLAVGGQCEHIALVDTREANMVSKMRVYDYCTNIAKIYPYGLLLSCGKDIKIYDIRMQSEFIRARNEEPIKSVEVLSSRNFVTAGSSLTWWESATDNIGG